MKNHMDQTSITTPKQKINQTKTKYFLELTIAIQVKFLNIQSHIFFSFLTNIHWFQPILVFLLYSRFSPIVWSKLQIVTIQ